MGRDYLKIAGGLNFLVALLHVVIIFGGADWYRFFGAGEQMALMAEAGDIQPALITLFIAFVLAIWGVYAWSGSGVIPKLPFLKTILCLISGVYLLRGVAGLFAAYSSDNPLAAQNSSIFWLISSVICLIFALVHMLGLIHKWRSL